MRLGLTLGEKYRARMFEKVTRILELNREKVTGGWRKFNNEELHGFHSSPGISGAIKYRMKWAEHVAQTWK
jgi:hypothetical protein